MITYSYTSLGQASACTDLAAASYPCILLPIVHDDGGRVVSSAFLNES